MELIYVSRLAFFRGLFLVCVVMAGSFLHAQAQVSGHVFRDFDFNGVRSDTLPVELGVSGVTVRMYVDLGKTFVTTTTDADGNYSFSTGAAPVGKPVRIEFDNMPTANYNGAYGSGSGTSVLFVKSPSTTANLGIHFPADYCQRTNVQVAIPCYVNGNSQSTTDASGNSVPANQQAGTGAAIVSFPYTANGVAGATNFPASHLADASQVGTVWAMAYQRRSKYLFSAAVVKRHASFGPLGTGGIYKTDVATGITTTFLDVKTLGIDTGNDPHSGLSGDKTQASADPGPMTAMGRMSIGGMDISEDDKTLYFINLKDRRLYSIFIDTPAAVPTSATAVKSWAIPDPGCSNGDFRPWAVKFYHGKVYVGVVCSAETSQQQTDLSATIYSFDPTENTPVFTKVLAFPLDFKRGSADVTTDPDRLQNACTKYDHWLPWNDAWPTPCGKGEQPVFVINPQPIVVDLEFDDDGSLIIGFLDRFGHLAGLANHDPQGNGFYDGFTGGDLLRAAFANGIYTLESNGKSGNRTGSGAANNEGPGGGEFYGQDNWFFIDHYGHNEVTNGGLSLIPGYSEIISSSFDPVVDVFRAGGLKVFNNKTGQTNRSYVLYSNAAGSFGKASGLGDPKVLCDPAPIEIGNRFWFDDNRDGLQNPYEPGVDGIVLTLHDMNAQGVQIGSQTTHDGGQFYFNNTTVPAGISYNHAYEIRVDTAQFSLFDMSWRGGQLISPSGGRVAASGAGGRKLATNRRSYTLSPATQGGSADFLIRDSDAFIRGTSAIISANTLDAGQNDFTYDLSVYSCPVLAAQRDTISVCAGAAVDSIAVNGQYFSRVDSVRYVLFSSPQSGTAAYTGSGTVLGTVYPDANGQAVLRNPVINTLNGTSATASKYVYALVFPMPEDPNCRKISETVLRISPAVAVTTTGGQLTCSATSLTLTSRAFYGDGTSAPQTTYAWTGPAGFTSTLQNPVINQPGDYSLTTGNLSCPSLYVTATTSVVSNTALPVMTTSVSQKTCVTCSATIAAVSNASTLSWTGPGNFSLVGAGAQVVASGIYVATATSENGCTVQAEVVVDDFQEDFICPPPVCLPITIQRIR